MHVLLWGQSVCVMLREMTVRQYENRQGRCVIQVICYPWAGLSAQVSVLVSVPAASGEAHWTLQISIPVGAPWGSVN